MTPMTMPAIAPPLRPLLATVVDTPAMAAVLAAVLTGVSNGTVVVAEPTEVTVTIVALVGRMNAVTVGEVT